MNTLPELPIDRKLLDEVVIFYQENLGFGKRDFETLNFATRINQDLGVDGDDSNDLVPPFFQHFQVDITEYDCLRYFHPEGFGPFFHRRPKDKERRGSRAFTFGMLYQAALTKKWCQAVFESAQWRSERLYERTEELPVKGFVIRR
ncbi:Protein of unknown function [Pseudomonas delhiensis]|uniref:Uncharacterized protein n=1 Tax=Pseudomonas delhiensis TaxID=366289 RepID=A0A239LLG1_9PSED|nr:DUF1493 family protein [Pseudomonas delhiensis]SDK71368.1 Protein of unknown function [Pseudomonas delhiensis]SNT31507.1 Protein of unknown function [Pseudomonas delhiensis]